MRRFDSAKISVPGLRERTFVRADLEFYGVDHSGASYEGRIYVNNDTAQADTPTELADGYVGSFHVFGHGGCLGDVGHCEVADGPLHAFDRRLPHQLEPQKKVVIVTEPLRELLAATGHSKLVVSVVPVVRSVVGDLDTEDVLQFERLALVTYE